MKNEIKKRKSVITVACLENGMYCVHATGLFGGGWQRTTGPGKLSDTIITAWQQYGSNPLGCAIVHGDIPADAERVVIELRELPALEKSDDCDR